MAGPTKSTAHVYKKGFSFLDAPLVTEAAALDLLTAMGLGNIVAAYRAKQPPGWEPRRVLRGSEAEKEDTPRSVAEPEAEAPDES